jgi:ABC-type spermidine/putrescine transport system permease subunit II
VFRRRLLILVLLVATVLAAVVTGVAAAHAGPLPLFPWSARGGHDLVATKSQFDAMTTALHVGRVAAVLTVLFATATVWALIRGRRTGGTARRGTAG